MSNSIYKKISTTIIKIVEDLGDDYKIKNFNCGNEKVHSFAVEVNGQNYLQVDSAFFLSYSNIFPQTKYQKAIFHSYPNENGEYMLWKNGKVIIGSRDFSVDLLVHNVFGNINNKLENRDKVAQILGDIMGREIMPSDLMYDIHIQKYYFRDWNKNYGIEYLFFCNYFRSLKKDGHMPPIYSKGHIGKYTSLESAVMILESGNMRMMSVTAMNDIKEIGHLNGEISKQNPDLENKTKLHFARQRYITCFSDKLDDLTMWRLYGDNGKGVCLVFSQPEVYEYYFPVDYCGKKSSKIIEAEEICHKMEEQGIDFIFKSKNIIWQYFLKPSDFSYENEYRCLRIEDSTPTGYTVSSNGIVSTYKDIPLYSDNPQAKFPATLIGIILGPNMAHSEVNKYQLEALAHEKSIPLIKGIQYSSIDCYI